MKLEILKIKGFRKLKEVELKFGDASFLIGENNVGKSTALKAIELLLTNKKPIEADYTKIINHNKDIENVVNEIILEGTFINIPEEANEWKGYKGRIYLEAKTRKIKYRKTFSGNIIKYEMWEQKKELKYDVMDSKKVTIESLIKGGIEEEKVRNHFEGLLDTVNLNTKSHLSKLESFFYAWNYEDNFSWVNNPGGIPQVVISKLPKFVLIPAEHKANEIGSDKKTALGEVMSAIFDDVVEKSENFEKVKQYFLELETEIDTENTETEFGILMESVNKTIKNIFPESEIFAKVNLSDPNSFLKPKYDIQLGSNIMTSVDYQGTGMIRATAFSLLKFREDWRKKRRDDISNLIIAFEEPELFLHPNASNQMRDTIYELAGTNNQIICTSHSPYMIDLSREKENQVINNISIHKNSFVKSSPFSVTEKFLELQENERDYIKMLVKIDDYFARAFFTKKVVIVEGDTEDVVIRKSISILTKEEQNKIKSDFHFIKARGKATIPPLVKYFKALGIYNIFIIHDRDKGIKKAEEVNPRIFEVIESEGKRIMLEECIEDVLGYKTPIKDKPYKAYIETKKWKKLDDIPKEWKNVMKTVFKDYMKN